MNENSQVLMDVIYDSDAIFLSAIEADDPSELEDIITKYKSRMHKDVFNVELKNIQWKKIYDELKSIDSPVDFIERNRTETDNLDQEMFKDIR